MKRVLLIGTSGTISQAVYQELLNDCNIITVNHSSGDFQVDLGESSSISKSYTKTLEKSMRLSVQLQEESSFNPLKR